MRSRSARCAESIFERRRTGADDFRAFDDNGLIQALRGRTKVYGSTHMHSETYDKWGYTRAFEEKLGGKDEFILGVGNHDPQPLKQIAKGIKEEISVYDANKQEFVSIFEDHKAPAIKPLAEELKLDPKSLEDPVSFSKAKHAEPLMAKNHYSFYMNVFGREERFDMQGFNTTRHPEKNYAYKVPSNYKEAYHKSLQEGYGFNVMDGMEKVFKAKGYEKSNPELYEKIVKFRDILQEKEPAKPTRKPNNKNIKLLIAFAGIILAGTVFGLKLSSKNQQNKALNKFA